MSIEIPEEALEQLRDRKGTWAAYQNMTMDSSTRGHIQYLKYGADCTYETPPPHLPDGVYGLGWKYRYLGLVDLETGTVTEPHIMEKDVPESQP